MPLRATGQVTQLRKERHVMNILMLTSLRRAAHQRGGAGPLWLEPTAAKSRRLTDKIIAKLVIKNECRCGSIKGVGRSTEQRGRRLPKSG